MPHEMLRSRLLRRRRQRRREMMIIAGFILALGVWLWYFFIYARTPEFALHELQDTLLELGMDDAQSLLAVMVDGKRLKDISDLPLDLAV